MVARKPAFLYDLWGKQNYQELFVYRSDLGQNSCHFLPYFDYNSAVFWIFLQDKLHSFKLDHSLWHHSACASITVQQSGHFHVPIYQRLREDQFHAPTDQLCREVHGNFFDQLQLLGGTRKCPCFFCKNFLNKLSFWQCVWFFEIRSTLGRLNTKKPKSFCRFGR